MDLIKIFIYVYIGFFVLAGINHFLNPQFYEPLVPRFIPFPQLTHQLTGVVEIVAPLFLLTKYGDLMQRIFAYYFLKCLV